MKRIRLQPDEVNPEVYMAQWEGMDGAWRVRGPGGVDTEEGIPRPEVGSSKVKGGVKSSGGKRQVVEGETLLLTKVSRLQMGSYLCIASNGIPPSVSKRAHLKVQCRCLSVFLSCSLPPRLLLFRYTQPTLTCLPSVPGSHNFTRFPSSPFY